MKKQGLKILVFCLQPYGEFRVIHSPSLVHSVPWVATNPRLLEFVGACCKIFLPASTGVEDEAS